MTTIEQLQDVRAQLARAEAALATLKRGTATATPAPAATILDRYNAMAPGKEKDAFLKANHRELFALQKAKAAAAAKPTGLVNITK